MILITPYRNRAQHLAQFLRHYSDFEVVVVEQLGDAPFNRAKLLNVGFLAVSAVDRYVFSDVDMLAEVKEFGSRSPVVHYAGAASQFKYRMPYATYFGGVCGFTYNAFVDCGGYSNKFWGWGSEDDEMYNNVVAHGYQVEFMPKRFKSLAHRPSDRSHHNKNILLNLAGRQADDGISHCTYRIDRTEVKGNYTHIYAEI